MTRAQSTKKSASDLMVRIVAAAVLVPVALFGAWVGGALFGIFIAGLGVLMALEWTAMICKDQKKQQVVYILSAIAAGLAMFSPSIAVVVAIIAVMWGASIVMALSDGLTKWHVLGVPYIALPLLALVVLRADGTGTGTGTGASASYGLTAVIIIFACVWTADTLAYFAGRGFGGPKLWPAVSPNKTWSGFFGAVAGGLLAAVLVFYFSGLNNLIAAALLGAAIGGLEQGGDLFESAAKRKFGIKDSGSIIPGHGGVLDRVDGLMAAAIAAWAFGAIRSGSWENAASGLLNWPL